MGIVHDNRKGLACIDELKATGHTGKIVEAADNIIMLEAFRSRSADRGHDVINIEFPCNVKP